MCIVFFHSGSFVYYICDSHYRVVGCCWCFTFLLLFLLPLPSLVDFFSFSFPTFPSLFTAEMVVFFLIVSSFGIRFSSFSSSSLPTLSSMSWSVCVFFSACFLISSFGFYAVIACCRYYYTHSFHIDINISLVRSCRFHCARFCFLCFFLCLWVLFCLMMAFFSPFSSCCHRWIVCVFNFSAAVFVFFLFPIIRVPFVSK